MDLAKIKASIPKLSVREQAELDVWLQERERASFLRIHKAELQNMLAESYEDVAAGRCYEWTDRTVDEIRAEARKELARRRKSR